MRRKAGIAVGVCAALVLAGVAGASGWAYAGDGRTVGTWHEVADVPPTPVAAELPTISAVPSPSAATVTTPAPVRTTQKVPESAILPTGRQRVGDLVRVNRMIRYLDGGPRQVVFRYPGASYVKLHFNRLAMLPGEYVTVSSADGKEKYRYKAPKLVGTGAANLWAMSVTGDTAVLEVHKGAAKRAKAGALAGRLGIGVDRVARGFSRAEQRRHTRPIVAPSRTSREESVCGADTSTDAVCYRSSDPVAYTRSKAIARLLINGTELCTGWRIGARNRIITNNHCFTTSAAAFDTEVWFNYQCATCGGFNVFQPTKVWGEKVLATDHVYDYTLFTVDNFAAVKKFGFLQLDTVRPAKGQELYVPQHPAGEPTRIAGSLGDQAGNCAVTDPGYTGYAPKSDVAYYCDTEGGSSGSPVISRATNKVVALHHFGGCPNSGVRGDLLAAKLRAYL